MTKPPNVPLINERTIREWRKLRSPQAAEATIRELAAIDRRNSRISLGGSSVASETADGKAIREAARRAMFA